MHDTLLTEMDVSKHLRVSVACVRRWRLERRGPKFVKIGSLVRYRPEDLEQWVNAQPTGGEREDLAIQIASGVSSV
jgi:predicted DNA-binding transcriptional regulator AlpA